MRLNQNALIQTAVVATFFVFFGACKSNNFNGEGASAPAPTAIPATPTPVITATPTATPTPSPCVGDGVTQARLLTTSINVNAANQYLDYELALTDCNGKPKAITNQPLKFDIDAITNSLSDPLAYQFSASDGSIAQVNDTLESIRGSDLFGKTGSSYAHWQTQSISYASVTTTIKLRLDVSNRMFRPINSTSNTLTSPVSIPTYLRLGDSTPVQQNITVNP